MKIASWNVNSLNVRLPAPAAMAAGSSRRTSWRCRKPSSRTTDSPDAALAELGYRSVFCGQKTYNGVALLSRLPFAASA
jgi:exodeoxyribonuclease-3